MRRRPQRFTNIRIWVGMWTALFLFADAGELHGPAANTSTLLTSSPVLAESPCGESCEHFDRYEGELLPEHPTARLKHQPSLGCRPPTVVASLVPIGEATYVEPATEELLHARLQSVRAPPRA